MKQLILILLSSIIFNNSFSQTLILKGTVKDEQGQGIPFASIYLKNSSKGSSANSEGEFQLKLEPGTYDVLFKAIGYASQTKTIVLKESQQVQIILKSEVYQLKDVVIRSGAEDPAYRIIRNAIKKRKSYQKQTQAYSVEVYMKSLQRVLNAPKKFLGKDIDGIGKEIGLDSNRRGILYLSESESKLSFLPPDNYKEEMISSKVSGNKRSFSFNRASEMKVSFYDNNLNWEGLNNRPLISPIAENALTYYKYKLLGSSMENGIEVNKIQVIPKRKSDPVFNGNIYIMDDSWRIYGTELFVTKDAGMNFLDTLKIQQSFLPINKNDWRPSSTRFDFTANFLGFGLGVYSIAVYRNYSFENPLDKKDFKELMKVTAEVTKKDSSYWLQARPIPLTLEEQNDYIKKQALSDKRNSKSYLDSVDKVRNKFKPGAFLLFGGYTHRNRFKKDSYHFDSILGSSFYNTVEGGGIDYGITYNKQIDTLRNRNLRVTLQSRYAFKSQLFNPSVNINIPLKETNLGFNVGSDMLDMNSLNPIKPLSNSLSSLVYERNFTKLYQKRFAEVSISKRIFAGVRGFMSAEWSDRKWLPNSTNYKWVDVKDREYTSNNPFTPTLNIPTFSQNQAFTLNFNLSYNFSNKYVTYPSGRYYVSSKYPTVNLNYRAGIKSILGSDADYHLLSANATKDNMQLGQFGKSLFWVGAGKFIQSKSVFYTDYQHFSGNQRVGYEAYLRSFLFLNYYTFSTKDEFIEGHYQHNFSGLIMSKIPLIRKLKLKEIVGANYLSTPQLKNYSELYAGLQYLNFQGQYGVTYVNGKQVQSGFRLAFKLF